VSARTILVALEDSSHLLSEMMPASTLLMSNSIGPESLLPMAEVEEQQATENIVSLANTEELDRKKFLGDLNKFMAEIGKPLSKIPIMGYKELDLYQLFKEVVAFGGFNEVVRNVGTWSKIWKRLGNFDPSITDSSFRLKKNYERYLLDFEYHSFPDHRIQAMEFERQPKVKRTHHCESGSDSNPSTPTDSPISRPKSERARKHAKRKSIGTYSISKDMYGCAKMPLCFGELTIECLGTIIPRHPFITDKHIYPVGFSSTRYFESMINPNRRVVYTSQIVDGGGKPQFIVTAEDDPMNPVISNTPSAAWRTVLKRVMGKTEGDNVSVSGTLRFGLTHPAVHQLIQELPGADKYEEVAAMSLLSNSTHSKNPFGDFSDSESGDEIDTFRTHKRSKRNYDGTCFSARDVVFASREEIDALESAVATLYALKFGAL